MLRLKCSLTQRKASFRERNSNREVQSNFHSQNLVQHSPKTTKNANTWIGCTRVSCEPYSCALRSKYDILLEVNLLDVLFSSYLTNLLSGARILGTSCSSEQATKIFNFIAATIVPAGGDIRSRRDVLSFAAADQAASAALASRCPAEHRAWPFAACVRCNARRPVRMPAQLRQSGPALGQPTSCRRTSCATGSCWSPPTASTWSRASSRT